MESKPKSKFAFFVLIGLSSTILLAAPVIVLLGIGFFLDKIFHTGNIFMIGGTIIGFIGGSMNVLKLMKTMNKSK